MDLIRDILLAPEDNSIERLSDLRQKNILTEGEFPAKKAELLAACKSDVLL
jgi:hypothetical protein